MPLPPSREEDSGDETGRPSIIISATLPRFQLHFNVERVVTLKHMVDRLMGPNYGHRREADLIRLSDSLAQFGSSKPQ